MVIRLTSFLRVAFSHRAEMPYQPSIRPRVWSCVSRNTPIKHTGFFFLFFRFQLTPTAINQSLPILKGIHHEKSLSTKEHSVVRWHPCEPSETLAEPRGKVHAGLELCECSSLFKQSGFSTQTFKLTTATAAQEVWWRLMSLDLLALGSRAETVGGDRRRNWEMFLGGKNPPRF